MDSGPVYLYIEPGANPPVHPHNSAHSNVVAAQVRGYCHQSPCELVSLPNYSGAGKLSQDPEAGPSGCFWSAWVRTFSLLFSPIREISGGAPWEGLNYWIPTNLGLSAVPEQVTWIQLSGCIASKFLYEEFNHACISTAGSASPELDPS
jgi:hypothetical protein